MKLVVSDRYVDRFFHEPMAIPVFSDQRPPARSAGRIDWRLGGLLSRMLLENLLGPGPPFLLAREPTRSFPAVMLFWCGEFRKLSSQAVTDWTKRASRTMAGAGARSFTLAVWDLFGGESYMQDFAPKVMEGLHLGLRPFEPGRVRTVRLAWEPGKADVLAQELRRSRHRHPDIDTWEISHE